MHLTNKAMRITASLIKCVYFDVREIAWSNSLTLQVRNGSKVTCPGHRARGLGSGDQMLVLLGLGCASRGLVIMQSPAQERLHF